MNKPLTFKVTITEYTLEELKDAHRKYYGDPKTKKVTKQEIAKFIADLFESDIQ